MYASLFFASSRPAVSLLALIALWSWGLPVVPESGGDDPWRW